MFNGITYGFMWARFLACAIKVLCGAMRITRTFVPKFNVTQIRRVKLWHPNAAINKNTGGTLIKFGRYIRIDSEIKNIIHIHLRLLGRSINHFSISIIAGVIGGF